MTSMGACLCSRARDAKAITIMSLPRSKDVADLLLSEKANQLGHARIGERGRFWTNTFLLISTLLGIAAGATGLADLISNREVGIIALAATLSTAFAFYLFTTLKYDAHLRAQGKYEDLYLRTLECNVETEEGVVLYAALRRDFRRIVNEVNNDRASLKSRQVTKCENEHIHAGPGRDFVISSCRASGRSAGIRMRRSGPISYPAEAVEFSFGSPVCEKGVREQPEQGLHVWQFWSQATWRASDGFCQVFSGERLLLIIHDEAAAWPRRPGAYPPWQFASGLTRWQGKPARQ